MTDEANPFLDLTQERLEAMLRRAIWNTLILGLIAALALWKASGWRNAAMMATGAAISAVSILEWQRLIRLINARLEKQKTPRGAWMAAVFLVLRLTVFAGFDGGASLWSQPGGSGHAVGGLPSASRLRVCAEIFSAQHESETGRFKFLCRIPLELRAG